MNTWEPGSELRLLGVRLRMRIPAHATGGDYSVVEQLEPPGTGSPPHANSREDIVIAVLEGEVDVYLPGRTVRLTSGASVSVPRNTKHWTRNAGSTESRSLYTFVPGGFENFFVEAAGLGPDPDLEQIAKLSAAFGQEIAPPEDATATGGRMGASTPHEVARLFEERFNAGDLDGMLDLYEQGAVLSPQPGSPVVDGAALRGALEQLLDTGATLELGESTVMRADGIALVIHDGHLSGVKGSDGSDVDMAARSSDVLRRQPDGTWRIVIDNPWGTAVPDSDGGSER